jgi:hypothetical protein
MRYRAILLTVAVSACILLAGLSVKADFSRRGPTVTVSVQASDTSGGTLHYRWKSTDGTIQNVDGTTTTWTLPTGPGLHFAYVLVSNGLGGYTEKRIAVNTDSSGSAGESEASPRPYVAPPSPAPVGDTYRSSVLWGTTNVNGIEHDVHAPDVSVYMLDNNLNTTYPPTGPVKSDLRGDYLIPNLPVGNAYTTFCQPPGQSAPTPCSAGFFFSNDLPMPNVATTDYLSSAPSLDLQSSLLSGTFTLQDGTPCGTLNEFFGVHVTGTATLLDASNNPMGTSVRLNELGDYSLVYNFQSPPASVSLSCETAAALVVPITLEQLQAGEMNTSVLPGVTAPQVQSMSATLNGSTIASVNFISPPPAPLPSDIVPRADAFLAEKGLDTRMGACQYYKAIGAVRGCDAAGNLIAPITFQDWKRAVKFGPFAKRGVPTFFASYINKVDLNLARVHQSISYGPNQTAAVVCNHLGPPDFFNPPQAEIDTAVDNANHNKNLVACVAMDYMVSQGVNNNQPFVRFLIFGPSGDLLPSINLDGRREKFVPGTCVVCHGGDHYAGKFAEDGTGAANVGGHFLPYDVGNFEFSSKFGLRGQDQEQLIYFLNQNVLKAGPTPAEQALITGWYANQPGFRKVLNKSYIDASWPTTDPAANNFYQHVYARSCRTCHVALVEGYNFDHYQNITPGSFKFYRADTPEVDIPITVCGGDFQIFRDHSMANSLVTFNRFWLSADPIANTAGDPNQPDELTQFLLTPSTGTFTCNPGQIP